VPGARQPVVVAKEALAAAAAAAGDRVAAVGPAGRVAEEGVLVRIVVGGQEQEREFHEKASQHPAVVAAVAVAVAVAAEVVVAESTPLHHQEPHRDSCRSLEESEQFLSQAPAQSCTG